MELLEYHFEEDKENTNQLQDVRSAAATAQKTLETKARYQAALESEGDNEDYTDEVDLLGYKHAQQEAYTKELKEKAALFAQEHAGELFTNALTLARIEGMDINTSPTKTS